MSTPPGDVRPPAVWRLALRMLLVAVVVGLAVALVLAITGATVAGGGTELLGPLLPAVVFVGLGMAVPPTLVGLLALVIVSGRRSRRRDTIAVAIGGPLGALISPLVFYQAFAALGLVVALVVGLAVGVGFAFVVRAAWRPAS